jgi:prolyl 4-hydroxylase
MAISKVFSVALLGFIFTICSSQTCNEEGVCVADDVVIPRGANMDGKPSEIKGCVDRHPDCSLFVSQDQCTINPGWMIVNCPNGCNACHLLDRKVRCDRNFLNISSEPVLQSGTLTQIFERIVRNENHAWGDVTVLSTSPWVVTFDNFLTNREANAIIKTVRRWERSTDTGSMNEYGEAGRKLSSGRTSSNAWCREDCESDPDVARVIDRIEYTTTIPYENYESFQILRYENNQHYNAHHDSSANQYQLPCGPRILTMFLYLSDVEEGGQTAFPNLGIAVTPKIGKALLWANVKDENPSQIDHRTTHEARPVIRGTKYAANSWIHMHNFRQPNLWGCTGAFD